MPEINLALSENVLMEKKVSSNGKIRSEITFQFPRNPEIIEYDRRQSPYFWLERYLRLKKSGKANIASHENPLPTPSAGSVAFFYDPDGKASFVALSQKDLKAQRDPGFRVSRNGFPSTSEEWFTMSHVYREAFEEGIFITKSGELALCEDPAYDQYINETADMMVSKAGLNIKGTKRIPIKFKGGNDRFCLYKDRSKTLEKEGVVIWTPEIGFNFIQPMEIHYPLSELNLVDAETFPDGTPIGRDICVIDLKDLRRKLFGDTIKETLHSYHGGIFSTIQRQGPFLADKVTRAVLNQIYVDGESVYSTNWMDESYDFLNNPDVLRQCDRFNWSGLERRIKLEK